MRALPFLFLLLVAAHPPGGHHGHVSAWHMGTHDGSSPRDFGRVLATREHISPADRDRIEVVEPRRLNSFELGGTSRLGIGFVGGRNLGFRFKTGF